MVADAVSEALEGQSGIIVVSLTFLATIITLFIAGKGLVLYFARQLPLFNYFSGIYEVLLHLVGHFLGFI